MNNLIRKDKLALLVGVLHITLFICYIYWIFKTSSHPLSDELNQLSQEAKEANSAAVINSIKYAGIVGGALWIFGLYNLRLARWQGEKTIIWYLACILLLAPLIAPFLFLLIGLLLR